MITVVPAVMPVATPVALPIVATEVLELVHVPPVIPMVSVADEPAQTVVGPVKGGGNGVIVTVRDAEQPVPSEYVISAVPGDTPVTTPVPDPIVAIGVLLVVHEPPAGVLTCAPGDPTHIRSGPVIGVGVVFTVTCTYE